MKDPTQVLIAPFRKIWLTLDSQARAWITIHNQITFNRGLPARLNALAKQLADAGISAGSDDLSKLIVESQAMASAAEALAKQQESVIYPTLVGAWAIIEASLDDLLINIIANDPEASAKLTEAQIKVPTTHAVGSHAWVKDAHKRLESRAKSDAAGYVVTAHKACFAPFGVSLEYPPDRAAVIEQLNQVRNCILHNQGVVDQKAADLCPRLAKFLGCPVPATDPIFVVAHKMLVDYTLAWMSAFVHSDYLKAGLVKGAKNPFAGP